MSNYISPFTSPFRTTFDSPYSPGLGGGLPNTMTVELASGYLYARFPWDATYDAVQRITVTAVPASATANGCVAPSGIRLIPIATAREAMATAFNAAASAQYVSPEQDDSPPVKYNNLYVAGGHGLTVASTVTAASHGKTVADIGSEWSDGAKSVWIIGVPDANTLHCMLANIGANTERWFFFTNLNVGSLTHIAGATNTAAITTTAKVTLDIRPCVKNHTKVIKLNGATTITADGVYDCRFVDVEESYEILNAESIRQRIITGRPWATAPVYNDSSVDVQVRMEYVYRLHDHGVMVIDSKFDNLQSIGLSSGDGYVGFAQVSALLYNPALSETLNFYVPRISPIVGAVKTWDFKAGENITGAFESINFLKASWTSASNAPDRMVQYIKNSGGTRVRGLATGYSRLSGAGADIDNYTVKSGSISAGKKMYPQLLGKSAPAFGAPADALPARSVVTAVAYRAPFNLANTPEITSIVVLPNDTGAEVILDLHTNVTAYAVPVPVSLNGKTVTIVDSNGNLTLDSATVTAGAITITVTGGYGEATLQVA